MEMSGNAKKRINYCCEKCDFNTSNKTDYNRHIKTIKHLGNVLETKNANKNTPLNGDHNQSNKTEHHTESTPINYILGLKNAKKLKYECDSCGQQYMTNSGLWKHTKQCTSTTLTKSNPTDKDVIVATLLKQNSELHEKIIELCKNNVTNNTITNSNNNNKTFNLQFFLNETCKDAMNLKDFIDSVVLQLSDIDNIGEVGFIKGMANLITSKLNLLGETKRPIHCTDLKREVMYVKDENKWKKDANNEKMNELIQKMEKKLGPLMIAFSNNHKKEYRTDSEIIKHQQIIYEVYGGKKDDITNKNEIIQHISKKTTIEKTNHLTTIGLNPSCC
jgi:hypothetical protein